TCDASLIHPSQSFRYLHFRHPRVVDRWLNRAISRPKPCGLGSKYRASASVRLGPSHRRLLPRPTRKLRPPHGLTSEARDLPEVHVGAPSAHSSTLRSFRIAMRNVRLALTENFDTGLSSARFAAPCSLLSALLNLNIRDAPVRVDLG